MGCPRVEISVVQNWITECPSNQHTFALLWKFMGWWTLLGVLRPHIVLLLIYSHSIAFKSYPILMSLPHNNQICAGMDRRTEA